MTLILSRASIDYVLQVTDRLVTQGDNPFDPLANKNIVYCSKNSLVAIGYTGFAFIGDAPTDQWIAQQLIGEPFDRGIRMGRLPQQLDQGQSIMLLKERLDAAPIPARWQKQWKSQTFILCAQGWPWSKTRVRPVIEWLAKNPGQDEFAIGRRQRHWHLERRSLPDGAMGIRFCLSAAPPGNISTAEMKALSARIQDAPCERTAGDMVHAVRAVASRNPAVVPHCMSILITPPRIGFATIRFIPASRREAILETATLSRRLIAAYTPWIVGPNFAATPSLITGSVRTEIPLGPYVVQIEAAELSGGPILHTQTTQVRPKAP